VCGLGALSLRNPPVPGGPGDAPEPHIDDARQQRCHDGPEPRRALAKIRQLTARLTRHAQSYGGSQGRRVYSGNSPAGPNGVPLMSDVTRILSAIEQGDTKASEQLLPLVYDELRKLAAQKLAQEKPGQTLQATALVHEVYLRLVDVDRVQGWNSRGHFFAAAAEAMRRILVEQARRRTAVKRGGQAERSDLPPADIAVAEPDERLLDVHGALDELARTDAEAATLVKLRFFGGFTMTEIAEALGMSVRSAQDVWTYARSWLRRHMRSE